MISKAYGRLYCNVDMRFPSPIDDRSSTVRSTEYLLLCPQSPETSPSVGRGVIIALQELDPLKLRRRPRV